MKTIFKSYLKPYALPCIIAPLLKMTEAFFELWIPFFVAKAIDIGLGGNDYHALYSNVLILAGLAALGFACSITAQKSAAVAAVGFTSRLRAAFFEHILSLSFPEIDRVGTAALITRATSDMNRIQTGLNMLLRLFMRSPVIVFGAMFMAWRIHGAAFGMFFWMIVVLSLITVVLMRFTMKRYSDVQSALDALMLRTKEHIAAMRMVRAFRNEQVQMQRFMSENGTLHAKQRGAAKVSSLTGPLTFVVVNFTLLLLLNAGSTWIEYDNVLTVGQLVALTALLAQVLTELVKLANLTVTISQGWASLRRVEASLAMGSDMRHGLSEHTAIAQETPIQYDMSSPSVSLSHVTFSYYSTAQPALYDLTLNIQHGEMLAVIGRTGSGKSTLLHLIAGLYICEKGTVLFSPTSDTLSTSAQDDVADFEKSEKRTVPFSLQTPALFSGTVADNVRMGDESATDKEVAAVLETVCAMSFIKDKDNGIYCDVAESGANFSGGQKQRLSIARALIKKSDIVLLDDPTSALDQETANTFMRHLSEYRQERPGLSVVLATSNTAIARHADRILVLEDGHIEGIGTHEALLKDCEMYRMFIRTQEGSVSGDH